MKYLLFGLFLIPALAFGQSRYALIDKNMRQPILYTDSVTVEQITKGYFPVENKNVDTLIANLVYLRTMLSKRQRAKMSSFELHASNSVITTMRVPYAYGDRYESIAQSSAGEVKATITLINSKDKNTKSLDHIDALLAYLKSNQSFYKEPNELSPKLYNIVVITDK
jgi:hypothetical protein